MSQGDRDLTGLGQIWERNAGKVGQQRELIFLPLPQGDLELIDCWSRVLLTEVPSRLWHLSVQVSREELLLLLDCHFLCPGVRVPEGLGPSPVWPPPQWWEGLKKA